MIAAEGLVKRFGATVALDGLDLAAERGTVLGVLGPNGAGKTTAVRILCTLLEADSGHAEVAGYDVRTQPDQVRARIGLTGQYAAVDEYLTGRENLEMIGRLSRLPARQARARALELLDRFDLGDAGGRLAKGYSGGMRRRLDLAASLVAAPPVLFLDEPTTGLDPRSRFTMWDLIAELVSGGTTILLTTQYLEEADRLADLIAVVDHGRVIASGTSSELKDRVGGERLEVAVPGADDLAAAARLLARAGDSEPLVDRDGGRVSVPFTAGTRGLAQVVREFDAAGVAIDDLSLRRPTLDDVFLALTGHAAEDTVPSDTPDHRGEEVSV